MIDIQEATDKLNHLRNLGIKISVDDFGTGYSSLSYLKKLPIDCLKIDRSFVQDLERSSDSTAIVQAIIGMARQLNLGVIAEGVETAEELELLARLGCTRFQGYLFGRPEPIETYRNVAARPLRPSATDRR